MERSFAHKIIARTSCTRSFATHSARLCVPCRQHLDRRRSTPPCFHARLQKVEHEAFSSAGSALLRRLAWCVHAPTPAAAYRRACDAAPATQDDVAPLSRIRCVARRGDGVRKEEAQADEARRAGSVLTVFCFLFSLFFFGSTFTGQADCSHLRECAPHWYHTPAVIFAGVQARGMAHVGPVRVLQQARKATGGSQFSLPRDFATDAPRLHTSVAAEPIMRVLI